MEEMAKGRGSEVRNGSDFEESMSGNILWEHKKHVAG